MLAIFRKYQRYLYILITIVIVISFSFFGTYSAVQRTQYADKPAFIAVDGSEIGQKEVEELVLFLNTDNEDKLLLGGAWGPNFLNDGVIKKNFLETGLAEILVAPHLEELRSDLESRHHREKHYNPYSHPDANFISARNAWNIVSPEMNERLNAFQAENEAATPEGFDARVRLFLAERRFPHYALRMVLNYQQKQYGWVQPDPNLNRIDLALFGYHTVTDWFGPRFNRLVAEFILNSAIIAEQDGYEVSKWEGAADLYRNAEMSFQKNVNNPKLGVANVEQYLNEQLRRMGLDKSQAVAIWQKVMLFRRLFQDLGSSVLVDPFTIRQFYTYAKETIEGNLYQLPEELRLNNYRQLQKLETYLNAVSNRPTSGPEMLRLPSEFKTPGEIALEYPELVQKRFLLTVAEVDKRALQAKVGVKETWNWEVQDQNWEKLKQKFPELGMYKGTTEEERFAALDTLDHKTRARVDSFSRAEIVDAHPEWLNQALLEGASEKQEVGIRSKGENAVFLGLKNPQELIDLLEHYPEQQGKLKQYTADDVHYYRIDVLDRSDVLEVLTFAEAQADSTLDDILDRKLKAHYEAIREANPKEFHQFDDGAWEPYSLVQNQVEANYFAPILNAVNKYYTAAVHPTKESQEMIDDFAASIRLYAFMRGLREQFAQDPNEIEEWIILAQEEKSEDKLDPRRELQEQWKLEQSNYKGDRGSQDIAIDRQEAFSLNPGDWSTVHARANGDIAFFQLEQKESGADQLSLHEKVMEIHQILSVDAQKILMRHLLAKMEAKNALSLEYLNQDRQEVE